MMAGEVKEFGGVIRRLQALGVRLRMSIDPRDRELIRDRIDSVKEDANAASKRIQGAANWGDRDAMEALALFKVVMATLG